jgi:phosphoribosyl 1,2-cyclic phosphodiesterase
MAVRVEVLGSGSKGNCTFVQGGRTRILLDAGFSRAEIVRRLAAIGESPEGLDAVVLTHEHGDHVRGVEVLSRRARLPVACHADTWAQAGLAEAGLPEWIELEPGRPLALGDLVLEPFSVPHDAATTLAFRVRAEGLSIGYCTDLGHVTAVVRERLRSCHVLVLESNHDLEMLRDGPYPWVLKQRVGGRHGHLSNDAAAELLRDVVDAEAMVVALAHLSEANNDPALALDQARSALDGAGREGVRLLALPQDAPCRVALA